MTYRFASTIWLTEGFGGWHFISLPDNEVAAITEQFRGVKRRGWGSIPVQATIGKTTWNTSIFPDKKHGFVMAIKADVRKRENLHNGDTIDVTLNIDDI